MASFVFRLWARMEFGLADAEADVLEWLLRGYRHKGVAEQLGIKTYAARRHINAIAQKTGTGLPISLYLACVGRGVTRTGFRMKGPPDEQASVGASEARIVRLLPRRRA